MSERDAKPPEDETLRADKWLWYARFFKSRTLAAELCKGGSLRVSGAKVAKANHLLRVGDVLTFPLGPHIRVIRVVALGERRGPAPEARTLYEDLEPPQPKGSKAESAPPPGAERDKGAGRPTKKDRRQLDRLHGSGEPDA